MLTGSTSKEESKSIMARLTATTRNHVTNSTEKEIKMCYVTPEKVAKSKSFVSILERLAVAGRLGMLFNLPYMQASL